MMNSKYVPLSNARPRNPNMATHPPHVQSYSVKAFGPFFTWVYHAEDAAVTLLDNFEKMDTPVTMNQLKFLQGMYQPLLLQRVAADMSRPKTNIKEIQDRASAYRSSSGSIGIGEPRREALSIRPEVCSPHKQVGKHANKVSATFHMFREASPAEKVPLQDWDVLWFRIPLGAWKWKPEAPSPKWETLSKARFWTAMGNSHPKHGSSMDLGRLRARLASPLTEVKSTESGKVDV